MPQLRPSIAKEKVVKRSHSSTLCFLGVRGRERVSSLALEPHMATMNFRPAVVASCSPERSLDPAFSGPNLRVHLLCGGPSSGRGRGRGLGLLLLVCLPACLMVLEAEPSWARFTAPPISSSPTTL